MKEYAKEWKITKNWIKNTKTTYQQNPKAI